MDLGNKVAVVTGAAGGIGRAIAVNLIRRGSRVALVDMDEAGLLDTIAAMNGERSQVSMHVADVADKGRMKNLSEEVFGFSGDRAANIKRAKELLTQAGFPNGFSNKVWTRAHPAYQDPAIFTQAQLKDIGIDTTIESVDQAVFFAKATDLSAWDIQSAGHSYVGGDPNFQIREFWLTGGPRNSAHFSDTKVDQLFEQQNRETDPAKRRQLVNEIERITVGSYATVPFYFYVTLYSGYSFVKNHSRQTYATNLQMRDVWIDRG